MPIYYFDGNIIGRSSGRSAVGAAAYRAGEKLHSVAHAAYQSGERLHVEGDTITHDYTRKGGVVHSEILLPESAPEEYKDRQTLWNAVEKRERRKDAQLAREFIVALPREFDLHEQIEVMREYIQENFVNKGMIADFSIHDKGDGTPHSHIMLTTRHVSPEGFGKKNVDWNGKGVFLEWRKSWADVNNRVFERLGLEERIDHRSYREQGLDREPMIHLGYEATALEKKGIQTERGNHNREVQKRNEERAKKEANRLRADLHRLPVEDLKDFHKQHKLEKTEHREELQKIANEVKLERELQKIREAQKTVRYVEKPLEPETELPFIAEPEPSFVSELEKNLKAEKAIQHIEKMHPPLDTEKTSQHMNELKKQYFVLEKEKISLIEVYNEDKRDLPPLEYRVEYMDEHIKNIEILQSRAAQLREVRRNLRFLDLKQKKDTDEKISRAEQEITKAQDFFKNRFHIDPNQAPEELKRLQEEIRIKKDDLNAKQVRVQEIRKKQETIELEYHTQKLK
ncbi:MAG: MobA/MobL family protein [Nitrososphaerota archaeon]|nr:MobA/MobL family protein [Nitrososphaerota archaeon]